MTLYFTRLARQTVRWLVACGGCLAALPASAAEYCVTCAGPAAMYACSVEGEARDAPANSRQQLLCIQELARQGGHETCSVPRSAPSPCPGTTRIVQIPETGLPPAPVLPVEEQQPGPAEKQAKKPAEPRTVEEMANQTVEASKQGLKKAGEAVTDTAEKAGEGVEKAGSAVGGAAKKTWNCLKSLFSDC